ncbi:MAG: flagellin lysine-N-methylase [Clostridia bacterium]|nr:flagellin lysine-N-methylase [Clostridia bacterium]
MNIYVPSYYPAFSCIADKCRHSCCIGWEIDVDAPTLEKYRRVPGSFGTRLAESIADTDDGAHFILDAKGRCPFLDQSGLCVIIRTLGKEALCDICSDHPRYRNYFSDRVELGLGLCCEAAAELILFQEEKPEFIRLSGDAPEKPDVAEQQVFCLRELLLDMAFDRGFSVQERLERIEARCGICLPEKTADEWRNVYETLEILHDDWRKLLQNIGEAKPDIYTPRLFAYFLCRHLPGGLSDGRYQARIAFALHAAIFISTLTKATPLPDAARAYSEEIEYSDENLEALLSLLEKEG